MSQRILVVEDDEKLAALVEEFLHREGFAVELVHRGDEAVPKILQSPPDLVILDFVLPGIDGFEVCKQVRAKVQPFGPEIEIHTRSIPPLARVAANEHHLSASIRRAIAKPAGRDWASPSRTVSVENTRVR